MPNPLSSRFLRLPAGLSAVLAVTACATITHGSTQQVSFRTTPSGAVVWANGREIGTTPLVADLRRKDEQVIRISLYPYPDRELRLERKVSGWVAGNLTFGGLIGIAVDASTGAMYKLTPAQIDENLAPGVSLLEGVDEVLLIAVVMRPEPGWESIPPAAHAQEAASPHRP
jgi:hypothetical protein